MRITDIKISEFSISDNTPFFKLKNKNGSWEKYDIKKSLGSIHVMHVYTDEGLEGICTVGDARYTTITETALTYLKYLTIGEDPTKIEYLFDMLSKATRNIFLPPGWFGTFDNCLWDIQGKINSKSVAALITEKPSIVKSYYNYRGGGNDIKLSVEDTELAIEKGFTVLKDHFIGNVKQNIKSFESIRKSVGDEIILLHDAAGCSYSLDDAIDIGKTLEKLNFRWFEEPFNDRNLGDLKKLTSKVNIPILALETLMNDFILMQEWVKEKAVNLVRANARHGTTGVVRIARELEKIGINIELNGPGGLFGHVHSQLVSAIPNTSFYEYFPDGSRDELGKEIGIVNPPIPKKGTINIPEKYGWGYEIDSNYFNKKRIGFF
jgi:L-alanine-DL-glutamate epimerase-like enolase superfamily enzyme